MYRIMCHLLVHYLSKYCEFFAFSDEFYDLLNPLWDVHTITGALKLFFRELSEPLFTFAHFDEFLNAYSKGMILF